RAKKSKSASPTAKSALSRMMMTTFWHPDGTPMSAQQFMELLFGKLPDFFHNEEEIILPSASPVQSSKFKVQGSKFGSDAKPNSSSSSISSSPTTSPSESKNSTKAN